jgi:DNA polymerase-3 subunit alpha
VAYALGITDVDPLHYDLIFERFWNSGRADGFPDIDSDFSQEKRQEMIQYLRDRLGHDKVMAIGTVGRMKPKAVIDKLRRGTGLTEDEASELKKIISETHDLEIHGVDQIGWSRELEPGKVIYVEDDCGEEIEKWISAEPHRAHLRTRFVDMCRVMCSRIQLYGVHPSGVVISDVKTRDELPAYRRGGKEKGVPATQFAMSDVDKRYFVKLDVLGLRTLDTLEQWRLLMRDQGIEIDWSGLDKQEHPQEMWELLHTGFTAGIFQMETPVGKRLCGSMRPNCMDDMIIINAINRPGPSVEKYLAKRSGEVEVTYPHPRLKELLHPVLELTYGEFVFQEQVINYFAALGYDLGESDAVRKILGKKKPEALAALHDGLGEWEGRGYIDMAAAAGVPQAPAQEVWDGLERFASYSFNKSHAAAYGIIGFRCLFAKFYGPAQFYAACIRTAEGDKRHEMLDQYVNEARRQGLLVHRPDIEKSQALATVDDQGNIWFGFGDVKGVGESGDYFAAMRDELDYSTPEVFYEQFEERNKLYLKQKAANKKALTKGEEIPHPDLAPKSPKQSLSSAKIEAIYQAGAWDNLIEPTTLMSERQAQEEALLGVILTDSSKEALEANAEEISTLDDWEDLIAPYAVKKDLMEVYEEVPDDLFFRYEVCGIVTGVQERRGKASGKSFGIITITYGAHELEFVAFHNAWKANKFLFRVRTPGIFTIKHAAPSEYGESYQFMEGRILKP